MRRGGKILVLLGVVLGLLSAAGTFLILSTAQPEVHPIPTRSVIIAQQNIPARVEITPEMIGRADWPESFLPPGAFERTDQVIGKMTTDPIYQGQIVLPQTLVDKTLAKEKRSNASYIIPDGKVAVAFPNSALSAIGGAVQPGDYVDILLTLAPGALQGASRASGGIAGTEGQPVTQMMLQDVLILNMGSWGAAPDTRNQQQNSGVNDLITFVLDRQDALALKSAREQGTIEFALRPAGDHKVPVTEPVTIQYLNKRFNFNLTPGK
jgi:pilus assembly protein CpaB